MNLIAKLFGNKHERDIKCILPIVEEINRIYPTLRDFSDDELRARSEGLRQKIKEATGEVVAEIAQLNLLLRREEVTASGNGRDIAGEEATETFDNMSMEQIRNRLAEAEEEERRAIKEAMDEILPEAFALVNEGVEIEAVASRYDKTAREINAAFYTPAIANKANSRVELGAV